MNEQIKFYIRPLNLFFLLRCKSFSSVKESWLSLLILSLLNNSSLLTLTVFESDLILFSCSIPLLSSYYFTLHPQERSNIYNDCSHPYPPRVSIFRSKLFQTSYDYSTLKVGGHHRFHLFEDRSVRSILPF